MKAPALVLLSLLSTLAIQATNTVVLASPEDPYYALAREIARQKEAPLVESQAAALAADPVFLVWVVSPAHLTEQALVDYGTAVRDRPSAISLGLITGSTLASAKSLWLRAAQASARRCAYASVRSDEITLSGDGRAETLPLTAATIQRAIRESGYLLYSGHAGPRSWMGLRSVEVPDLGPIVVSTASCQTLRPWIEDNIAMEFVDKGAAAYAGFPSSPGGQYLIGQMGGMPFRHTWPEFPIGHVVQIQARGAMRTFARFPQYFLLGDPRISFRDEAPYRVVEDSGGDASRVLRLAAAERGFIPVRIPGGAAYEFVSVAGVSDASSRDLLFNSRLQMVDIGEDKYVILAHDGGDIRIELHASAPWHWPASDTLLDFLDIGVITGPSDVQLAMWGALLLLAIACWKGSRRHPPLRLAVVAAAVGGATTAVWLLYVVLRRESITVTAEAVEANLLYSAAAAILIACAMLLFLLARSRWSLLPAVFAAQFPGSLLLIIAPVALTLRSLVGNEPPYYNNATVIAQSLRMLLASAILAALFLYVKNRLAPRVTPLG